MEMPNAIDLKATITGLRIEALDVRPGDLLIMRYDQRYWTHEEAFRALTSMDLPAGTRVAVLPMKTCELQVVRGVPGERNPSDFRGYIGVEKGQLPE